MRLLLFCLILAACANDDATVTTDGSLVLLRETKLSKLLGAGTLEASGVALEGSSLRIAFDNTTSLATVDLALTTGSLSAGSESSSQYEAIAIGDGHVYLSIEGATGQIVDLASATLPTDLTFSDPNKGLEGLAWLGQERLLTIAEGDGAITILARGTDRWTTAATLVRPARAGFDDYSEIAVRPAGEGVWDVVILSQSSRALWLGRLTSGPWQLVGPGAVYGFPKKYCTLEGIAFLDERTFALVSDQSKEDGCKDSAESIHVFALP